MRHEPTNHCFTDWLYGLFGWQFYPANTQTTQFPSSHPDMWMDPEEKFWFRDVVTDEGEAMRLMQKVWTMAREQNAEVSIYENEILILRSHASFHRHITGPTLPVRVCRAAIFLGQRVGVEQKEAKR